MDYISDIESFEDFFRTEVVFKRTSPNTAVRRLFSNYPDALPLSLCFSMTITASALEEWRVSGPTKEWNDWERTSYWLRASAPARFETDFNIDIKSAIFEIYRAISIINCDQFLLHTQNKIDVKAGDLVDLWSSLDDTYFED